MTDPDQIARGITEGYAPCMNKENIKHLAKLIAAALRECRSEADELFVLDVDCELDSGCRKNNTCSGASHWLSVKQLEERGYRRGVEEAQQILSPFPCGCRFCIAHSNQRGQEGGK